MPGEDTLIRRLNGQLQVSRTWRAIFVGVTALIGVGVGLHQLAMAPWQSAANDLVHDREILRLDRDVQAVAGSLGVHARGLHGGSSERLVRVETELVHIKASVEKLEAREEEQSRTLRQILDRLPR